MGDYIENLDELSTDDREALDGWLALRKLERHSTLTTSIDDDALHAHLTALQDRGDVEVRAVRHRLFWSRDEYHLSEAGRRRLEQKRGEIVRLHAEVGGALATALEALAEQGVVPGVLLLERMILLHHRFDDERMGFFTGCKGVAAHVREFSTPGEGSGDNAELLELLALSVAMK